MNSIWQDVRFGGRMLWKHRTATLICAAALALGIGANTAMFSSAEAFLLRPVPFENADRVVALVDERPQQNILSNPVAPATFLEWKERAKSFESLGASQWADINLTGNREPQKVQGFQVSANFFEVLGVQPQLGRSFLPEEEQPGKEQEIILSHGLWERRYASDPNISGKIVKVDGKAFTVVGVMAKGFDYPMPAEAWMPLSLSTKERTQRDWRTLTVLGRLKPNVTFNGAAAEMKGIAQQQAEAFPDVYKGWELHPMPLRQFASGDLTREFTVMLLAATGFVLLIACANVANVQFARVTGRHKELAVRTAVGASRGRIVRQLLIESILLSFVGALFGLVLAEWAMSVMVGNMPADVAKYIAGWKTIGIDSGAFLFTLVIAVLSGIVSGIMPALFTSRANVGEILKESGRGSSAGRARHRMRNMLVIGEVALSLVLLIGAGLLVKGFHALLTVNENYHPESLLTLNLNLPETQYAKNSERVAFHEEFLQRLTGIAGVKSATLVTHVPYSNGGGVGTSSFSIEGRPVEQRGDVRSAIQQTVSSNYFSVMGIGLRDGRELTERDANSTQPVVVISRSLADRNFSGENPLGKKLILNKEGLGPAFTIVGIVDDVHYDWIEKDAVPTLYTSYKQTPSLNTAFALRTPGDPLSFVSAVREQLSNLDPNLPIFDVKPLNRVITESITGIAYVATMMGIVGIIALVLASVGVYGVMSYSVSERTNEIGIRMAMGAKAQDILRLVVGKGMWLTLIGMLIGLPVAWVMANALSGLLFGVRAADPFAFIVLPLILAGVATVASYVPASRALLVDTLTALRYE